jgi:hypothetical protein
MRRPIQGRGALALIPSPTPLPRLRSVASLGLGAHAPMDRLHRLGFGFGTRHAQTSSRREPGEPPLS